MTQFDVSWSTLNKSPDLINLTCRQVYVWLVTSDDKIIVVSKNGNQWQFPGGKPEVGESHKQTAVREVLEETGIDISSRQTDLRFFGYYVVRELHEQPYTQLRYILKLPVTAQELDLHSAHEDISQDESDVIKYVRAVTVNEALALIPWLGKSPEFQVVGSLVRGNE